MSVKIYGNGTVMTTRGPKDRKPPVCWNCRERKAGQIYGIDPNGNPVCADCARGKWVKDAD